MRADGEPHCQLQIGGIIRRQPFGAREVEHTAESTRWRLFVDDDDQGFQQGYEFAAVCLCDPPAALAQSQDVSYFEMPYCRNGSCFVGKTLQHSIAGSGRLVLEAPGESDGGVQHKIRHRRPSLMSCLTGMSKV